MTTTFNALTLEALPPSLISDIAQSRPLPTLEVWVSTPRAFRADSPSKADSRGIVYPHRSHRHYSRESES